VLEANAEGEKLDTVPFNPADADLPEPPKFLSDLRAAETAAWDKARTGDAKERAEAYQKDIPKAEKDVDNWFKQHADQIPEAEYDSAKDLTWRAKRLETVASKLRAPILNEAVSSRTLNGIEASIDNQAIRRGQTPGAFRRLLGEEGYRNWKSVVDVLKPPESTNPIAAAGKNVAMELTAFGIGALTHVWGGALGTVIGLEFARKFILDRALFNPEFGKWFTDAFSRFKNTGGKITPDMVNNLHDLIQKSPLTPAELKEAGFKDNEIANGDHAPIVGETKLSQGPAPAAPAPSGMTPEQRAQFKAIGMSDAEIDAIDKMRAPAPAPAVGEGVGEGVGGHAGGGAVSAEELARGKNWMVGKEGTQVTYDGALHRPEETPEGGAHVTEKPDGTLETNAGTLTPQMEQKLRAAMAERDATKLSQAPKK
jgi:hypothetical protein